MEGLAGGRVEARKRRGKVNVEWRRGNDDCKEIRRGRKRRGKVDITDRQRGRERKKRGAVEGRKTGGGEERKEGREREGWLAASDTAQHRIAAFKQVYGNESVAARRHQRCGNQVDSSGKDTGERGGSQGTTKKES